MIEVEPFTIKVEDSVLEDLEARLKNTRFDNNTEFDTKGRDYGQELPLQHSLVEHWRDSYDWRAHEAKLNQFHHFRATIRDNQKLHFIHERSRVPGAIPLLLIHGWPGSVYEFHKVIPSLTAPEPGRALRLKHAFHVIAPSIPGFGWSDPANSPGMGTAEAARVFHELMVGLGYEKVRCLCDLSS
jgi:pimeloyl-ACP methyl ester carboxylesterase